MRRPSLPPLLLIALAVPAAGANVFVSTDSAGLQHPGRSQSPEVSDDGRWVAFLSAADLAPGASTNPSVRNVYVKDLQTGATTIVDVTPGGAPANGSAGEVSISGDGRFVAFLTQANNLVTPAGPGVVLHDRDPDGNGIPDEGNGTSILASRDVNGNPAWPNLSGVDVSSDGRHVLFQTNVATIVPGDTNGVEDVFSFDRLTGATHRVSVGTFGVQTNGVSLWANASATGRFVVFQSLAPNLSPGHIWGWDVYRHDRDPDGNGTFDEGNSVTVVVSKSWSGPSDSNLDSILPDVSADGDTVVYQSGATNLVPGFIYSDARIYVRRVSKGATVLASVNDAFGSAHTHSRNPRVSANGRYVVFDTASSNLVSNDTNGHEDVFVRDLWSFRTTRITHGFGGAEPNANCSTANVSANGAVVAWHAAASNLVSSDTNGDLDAFAIVGWAPACPLAGWSNFGMGLAGTLGIPALTGGGLPQLGSTFTLQIGNARGQGTPALLIAGAVPTALPAFGGQLWVEPAAVYAFFLPAAGLSIPAAVPNETLFCGGGFLAQAFEQDPAAIAGVSISAAIAVTIGQ